MNELTPHPQAEPLRAIADGKQMQYFAQGLHGKETWFDCHSAKTALQSIGSGTPIRIKPPEKRYITRTVRYPEPLQELPKVGEVYWIPVINFAPSAERLIWSNDGTDRCLFEFGLCFAIKDDAIDCAQALFAKGGAA